MSSIFSTRPPAILVLADGSVFHGYRFGASGHCTAELVFNTAMSGYQEILTDPSYAGQIVALTAAHIGNVGTNNDDAEASRLWAAGLVIHEAPMITSNFRSTSNLNDYLIAHKVVAICGVDTRRLTRHMRLNGAQNACILSLSDDNKITSQTEIDTALNLARQAPNMTGQDLARVVSVAQTYQWPNSIMAGSAWDPREQQFTIADKARYRVVAYDFGIKRNILRLLNAHGCDVTVVPAQTPIAEVLAQKPDGVFFSNGPGDPEPCDYAIHAARVVMEQKIPTFGICLGHQILALASGAKTVKMKFGHHGANHPVKDLRTGRVFITSQNHGFAVDQKSLPAHCQLTHISLFDNSCQGFIRTDAPAMAFQGHPEASPGPTEIVQLFQQFTELMKAR